MATTGRSTEPRTISALTKTSASAVCTGAPAGSFSAEDVGRSVTGTGVAAGTTVLSVQSATAITLSANATASNSSSVVLGQGTAAATGYYGWSPETTTESGSYTVAAVNASTAQPDRVTDPTAPRPIHRGR